MEPVDRQDGRETDGAQADGSNGARSPEIGSTSATAVGRRGILSAVAAALLAGNANAAAAAGRVEELRGQGFAEASARRMLSLASEVFVGDLVGTMAASIMELRLGTATQVRLGPETQLKIDRFLLNAGGELVLERGATLITHDPSEPKSDVLIRSPFGLIAVRGTRFFVGPSGGRFSVFVQEGRVMVTGVRTAVTLTAGLGTSIARPGSEPDDPSVWGKPRIDAALALVGVG